MKIAIAAAAMMLALCAAAAAEDAAPARKINFATVLTDIDGKPFNWDCRKPNPTDDKKCDDYRLMSLALLGSAALTRNNAATAAADQIHRALLAQEIYKAGEVALDGKDTALLCDAIASFVSETKNSMIVTLRACELIDPARARK